MAIQRTTTSIASLQDKAEDLSIAAELKFLIPFLPCKGKPARIHDGPQLEVVDYIERATQLDDAYDKLKLWQQTFSNVAAAIRNVLKQQAITSYDLDAMNQQERDCWLSYWVVKRSMSAEPAKDHPHRADWIWVPVEVNSPRLSWRDPTTIAVLRSVMDAIKSRYYIVSNYTCEVHVHAGRMDGRPFTLPTLKKLAILCWAAEPVLRKVKDPRSPNHAHVYTWSNSTREYSRLAAELKSEKVVHMPLLQDLVGLPEAFKWVLKDPSTITNSDMEASRLIAATRSHTQLGRLMSGEGRPYRRLGFNFSAFGGEDERARTNPRTVECRFLEGTIDTDVVVSWVQIFGKMVEAALDGAADGDRFTRLATHRSRGQGKADLLDYGLVRLMQRLGIREEVYRPIKMMIRGVQG
ncbi:hypothetical protein BKA67DRAFT_517178 [Truncatella angustata]|uniref:Uncharacterized protein n=1 Tax=Truncatella angustata TaxID=152316 RepID=A0A9P8UL78_9PEZI|nr:uncharacterized protein BKA67DRAFT_517178 [Truncatella angustata]KAH6654159.1 hypothetical protein BKA67DRAFT_517178 [Truncatella angustata]